MRRTLEQIESDLKFTLLFPHRLDYYVKRAVAARERSRVASRLAASTPYRFSAGACR